MKVCFFNTVKSWGGGEKWHFENAVALKERGCEVAIFAQRNGKLAQRAKEAGINVFQMRTGNLSFLNLIKKIRLRKWLESERFDVIIFNTPTDVKFASAVSRKAGIKHIVLRRGSALPIKNNVVNRKAFDNLTMVIANSKATKDSLYEKNSDFISESKLRVLYNGIKIPASLVCPDRKADVVTIGNLGRMVYQKGQDLLIDVANELNRRGVDFRVKIGGIGVMKEKLEEMVNDYGLQDKVEFCGFITNAYEFLSNIDIFALTSRGEGFGNVLAEAMAVKKPLISFDCSSAPEVVCDGVNGLLVKYADISAYADAIESLINDEGKRKRYGENGYSIVRENFEFEKNVDKLLALFK